MKSIAHALGIVVFAAVFFPAAILLERACGTPVVMVVGACCGAAAWCCHTERSRLVADLFVRVLAMHGLSMKAAATEMGQTTSALSEAVHGTEQLSLSRMASLQDAVLADFGAGLVELFGHGRRVMAQDVADLVEAVDRHTDLLRAFFGPKRMAGMAVPVSSPHEEKGVA